MAVTEMRLASACSAVQQSEQMTVKKCPPFIDAMTYGFLIPLVTDLRVEDGAFAWDFNLPGGAIASYSRSPIDFHDSAQVEGTPFFKEDRFIIKFNCFWTIESPPGYSLLIIHPINRHDLPFTTLTGSSTATSTRIISSTFRRAGAISISLACCRRERRLRSACRCGWSGRFETISGEAVGRLQATAAAVTSERGVYRRQFRAPKR